MKTVSNRIEPFKVIGVKPGFNQPEEKGVSAFEAITEQSFPGKWKVILFLPEGFHFRVPDRDRRLREAAKGLRRS